MCESRVAEMSLECSRSLDVDHEHTSERRVCSRF